MEGRACLSCVARTTSILAHTHTHCCHCQWHWKLDFSLPADRFGSDSLKRPVMRRRRRRWWFLAARFPSIFDRLTHRSVQLQRADLRGHFRAFPRSIEGPRRHPAVVRIPTLMKLLLWRPFHGLLALFFSSSPHRNEASLVFGRSAWTMLLERTRFQLPTSSTAVVPAVFVE